MRFFLLQAAFAQEIEADTALICDTQQQAEKVAAILPSDAPGTARRRAASPTWNFCAARIS
jgi:hypothetical protein